jgi:hypothetical protein
VMLHPSTGHALATGADEVALSVTGAPGVPAEGSSLPQAANAKLATEPMTTIHRDMRLRTEPPSMLSTRLDPLLVARQLRRGSGNRTCGRIMDAIDA